MVRSKSTKSASPKTTTLKVQVPATKTQAVKVLVYPEDAPIPPGSTLLRVAANNTVVRGPWQTSINASIETRNENHAGTRTYVVALA